MNNTDLLLKYNSLPEELKQQVLQFIEFLQSKKGAQPKGKPKRKAGLAKGLVIVKDDFHAPLDDFKAYM